jgi:hypothetical protein
LPMQCDKVDDIPIRKGEYTAYKEMVRRVRQKFDKEATEESRLGQDELVKKIKAARPGAGGGGFQAPFAELAAAMLFDAKRRMERDGADEIARSQKEYNDQIKELREEYDKKNRDLEGCGAKIGLANEYMEKMSVVSHVYQKTYLRIYKDFYHDNAYWSFFSSLNDHLRRFAFCRLTSGLLGVLLQLAETHFLDVNTDCASSQELKKDAEEIEVEANCPIWGHGFEFPFVVGKVNVDCEKIEIEFGEAIVVDGSYNFRTGETILALGPGFGVSLIGHSEESLLAHIPQLKAGPLKGGVDASLKGQIFLDMKDFTLVDYGAKFTAELDFLGLTNEVSTGYTIGMNSGLRMEEGIIKDLIDKYMGPPKEAPQLNKNVKKYKQ